jgi:flagellar FliJ protein
MSRAKRLAPVQNMIEAAEQRLAQSVAGLQRRLSEAENKLTELERYRAEYETGFTQRVGAGLGVAQLRDYQAFLGRISDAIRQQQAVVQRACAERDAEQQRWQQAARRVKAIDHVVDQWQAEQRRAADRREQHDTDERGQRIRSREP